MMPNDDLKGGAGRRLLRAGVSRRSFVQGAALGAGALAAPSILRAQDKPSEIIVRAWGGAWGDALQSGVADGFTAATGIPVRLDFTEDNEIKPKIWSAVDQGRIPPIHVNWDTTTNATISARRGV
jgi:putative spermidine/putrescine transport system substrate-binding protein